MSEWQRLDDLDMAEEIRDDKGVKIRLFLSPFDVPEAVRGYYDQKSQRFRIEFRYVSEEAERIVEYPREKYISLFVGKNSGRLLRIDVDVNSLKAPSVQIEMAVLEKVEDAIDELNRLVPDVRKHGNYDLAKKVIASNKDELFEELVPA
ncbi:MAG TPA: hypothetical protein DCX07_04000 [Phycisphaerales bacterium]|nr:hypothetical protein [Phycisphaerales bacterium]